MTAAGQDGAHVQDGTGREHRVHWHEITGKHDPSSANDEKIDPFIEKEVMDSLPDKVNQPHDNWDDLRKHGEEGLKQFSKILTDLAEKMHLRTDKKPDDLDESDLNHTDGFLFIGSLKGEQRAREKVESDYGGDWTQLRDVVRATISVHTLDDVRKALKFVSDSGLKWVQKPKDRFGGKPTDMGYRDIMGIVRLPNGMLAELQFHAKQMSIAKKSMHKSYDVTRSLQGKYNEEEPTDAWSDEDHAAFYEHSAKQRKTYSDAWNSIRSASGGSQKERCRKLSELVHLGCWFSGDDDGQRKDAVH